jgi:hypothetical protein
MTPFEEYIAERFLYIVGHQSISESELNYYSSIKNIEEFRKLVYEKNKSCYVPPLPELDIDIGIKIWVIGDKIG